MTSARIAKEQEIVLAQLMATSPTYKLSIGTVDGMQTFTADQLIGHVTDLDEFGIKFIETQMEFLRSFKNGDLYRMLAETPAGV